jgi:4-amino-4-deoxy-L-arabinose transferase-like glycosyltransferase
VFRAQRLVGVGLLGLCGVALALIYAGDLGAGTLWNTDDALYAWVVKQALAARSGPAPWFDYDIAQAYPLGVRWILAWARLLGGGLSALRLPAVIATAGAAIALCGLGLRRDHRGGWAAAIFLVQPLVLMFSQRVMHDALLAALTAAAIVLYARAEARPRLIIAAGLCCGLASLVKAWAGGIALAVIAIDLLAFRRAWLKSGWAWAALALALGLPIVWLASEGQLVGLVQHMFVRLFVGLPGHGAAAVTATGAAVGRGALMTIAASGLAGWLLLTGGSAGAAIALGRREADDRLLVIWLAVALAIVLVTRTFLTQYALIVVLPLCALSGVAMSWLAPRLRGGAPAAYALVLLALCVPLLEVGTLARHADDRTASLAMMQAEARPDALVCTVDVYHASPTFYAGRPVLYLSEDAPSLRILHRVFGEVTVPTLKAGEIAARFDAAPQVACITSSARARELLPQVTLRYEVLTPPEDLIGADVVLIRR